MIKYQHKLVSAAYAKIADVREEDSVENKELIAETGIKEGTVKPGIKSLTEVIT